MSLADAGDIPWPASRCDDPAVRHVPFSTDECCLGSTLCARPLGHRRSGRRRLDGVPVCVVPCARDQVEGPRCAVRAARTMADGARRVAGGFAATGGVTRAADLIEAYLHQRIKHWCPKCSAAAEPYSAHVTGCGRLRGRRLRVADTEFGFERRHCGDHRNEHSMSGGEVLVGEAGERGA
jgi:hypothetical protein